MYMSLLDSATRCCLSLSFLPKSPHLSQQDPDNQITSLGTSDDQITSLAGHYLAAIATRDLARLDKAASGT
ncbi:hypothetical protein BaRGS_00013626 [Batillaria attramentaria]|uniref:Uncharacterized protein n=1 Tax=Batillaria attramentaria TaxID=370345 RepID=A0ABD0L7I4_9CAEN